MLKRKKNLDCILNTSDIFKLNKCIANTNVLHIIKNFNSILVRHGVIQQDVKENPKENKSLDTDLATPNDHAFRLLDFTEVLKFLLNFRRRHSRQ